MSGVAIVAGGACDTGLVSALRLAGLGFDVALVDTDLAAATPTVQRIADAGRRCVAIEADAADTGSFAAALDQARAVLGEPGVLLNCVPLGTPEPLSAEERYEEARRSLRALFVCSRAVAARMVRGRWGRIVNVAQPAGAGDRRWSDGQTVLAGLVGFTRSAALELAAFGVTANYLAPSACYPGGPAPAPPGRDDSPSYAAGVASTAEFLISDQAAAITGQGGYLAGRLSSPPATEGSRR
jgi:novobiocin biosynthesis protein NovK